MNQDLDNDLFLKIKNNNQDAFEIVFLKYYSELCVYAASILGSKDVSEEIVQDVFVRFWESRNKITIQSSIRAYLYKTVHNQCINQIESWKIREKYSSNISNEYKHNLNSIPFTGDYPIANLIVKELEEKIKESIDALPDQCKEVFYLIRFKNKSYQETANQLNISLNTVKTQMQRAIFKLKAMLQEYLPLFISIFIYFPKK